MITKLRQLGLTSYESKIYLVLLDYGRLTAKEVSRHSHVPPTAVYPNIKSLLAKGLIQEYSLVPSSYEVVDPKIAVSSLITQQQKQLTSLGDHLIEHTSHRRQSKKTHKEQEVLTLSRGIEASRKIYLEELPKSSQTFYLLGWHFYKPSNKYTYIKIFKAALKRDVDVRIILTGEESKDLTLVQAYVDAGIKVKYYPVDNFSLTIRDAESCKITLKSKNLSDRFNIKINDHSLCSALQSYFLETWNKAHPISVLSSNVSA